MGFRMNIAIFTDAYYPQISGVVTSVMTLREELIKNGHTVYIITVSSPKDKAGIDEENKIIRIPSIPFKKWEELRIGSPFSFSLEEKIRRLNLDIIHSQTEFSIGLIGKRMAKAMNIPIIHTYHTMYEDYTHYIYNLELGSSLIKDVVKKLSKSFVNKCCAAIAPTKKTKDALISYGVTKPIYILPTGIDIKHFEHHDFNSPKMVEIRNKYKIPADKKILLYLGRISEEKSVDFIVDSLPEVLKSEPDTVLLIVGDGPHKKIIETSVNENNLSKNVVFTGLVPFSEVPYFYSCADVFVNASKTETQGLTIMEAMASQLPIVVFNDTNIAEHIKNGISGRLFDNKEEFVRMTIDALRNREENNRLIKNGMEVINSLSKENFYNNIIVIYNEVINNFNINNQH